MILDSIQLKPKTKIIAAAAAAAPATATATATILRTESTKPCSWWQLEPIYFILI